MSSTLQSKVIKLASAAYRYLSITYALFISILIVASFFGAHGRLLEILANLRLQLACLLTLGVFLLIPITNRKVILAPLAVLLICLTDIAQFYISSRDRAANTPFRLVTANVNTVNKNHEQILKVLKNTDADIICIQELTADLADYLCKNMPEYPYQMLNPDNGYFGIGLFSKVSLAEAKTLKLSNSDILTQTAIVKIKSTSIRIINTHPIAPLNNEFLSMRNNQLKNLAALSRESNLPVVLAGDLNATQFSPYFKDLLKTGKLKDSNRGFGYQPTWPAQLPLLNKISECPLFRIPLDHVLVSDTIQVRSVKLLPSIGSDHLAIEAELGVK